MNRNKLIYWIATGLLSLLMLFSASMYFLKTEYVNEVFVRLGYNERIVIPLAILKILGIIAIVSNRSKMLKEWAYFGFFIDFSLAFEAHWATNDGGHITSAIALVLLITSYVFNRKISN